MKKCPMRRSRSPRRGAAAVELAIVVPFLAFMFAVVVDYCRIFYAFQIVNNAARCGAMYASGMAPSAMGMTPAQAAQQAALTEAVSLNPPLQTTNVTVTITSTTATVTVNYPFQTVCPYLGLPSPIGLSSTVTMPMSPAASQ